MFGRGLVDPGFLRFPTDHFCTLTSDLAMKVRTLWSEHIRCSAPVITPRSYSDKTGRFGEHIANISRMPNRKATGEESIRYPRGFVSFDQIRSSIPGILWGTRSPASRPGVSVPLLRAHSNSPLICSYGAPLISRRPNFAFTPAGIVLLFTNRHISGNHLGQRTSSGLPGVPILNER